MRVISVYEIDILNVYLFRIQRFSCTKNRMFFVDGLQWRKHSFGAEKWPKKNFSKGVFGFVKWGAESCHLASVLGGPAVYFLG